MSKQLSTATTIVDKKINKQKNCNHKFFTVSVCDDKNDEVYHFEVCKRCGLKAN
jgi:hypothetical protein